MKPAPDPALAGLRVALRIARREGNALLRANKRTTSMADAARNTAAALGTECVALAIERAIARRTRGRA